jgi:LPS-assembly lipoprotein
VNRRHCLRLLTAAALAPLAGCGFHLRGSQSGERAELGSVWVEAAPGEPFADELRLQLARQGAALASASSGAELVVEVLESRAERRAVAVDNSGKTDEYELEVLVRYRVQRIGVEGGDALQTLRAASSYRFDGAEVLGADAEAEVLAAELREQLAQRLVRRLAK